MARINRVFLGWDRPLVHTAAEHLARLFKVPGGGVDCSTVTLIAPGGRLGRQIVEEIARSHRAVLGEFLTIDRFVSRVCHSPRLAPDWIRRLAWVRAASALSTQERAALWPAAVQNSPVQLLSMAQAIDAAARRLAGDGVSFEDARGAVVEKDLPDAERWSALSLLHGAYAGQLGAMGFVDPWTHRVDTGRRASELEIGSVVLVGVVELPGLFREILRRGHGEVTALIAAPPRREDLFDELGGADPSAWQQERIVIADAAIHVVEGPVQQAQAALVLAGGDNAAPRPDAVVIAVPDEEVLDAIERLGRSLEAPSDGRMPLKLRSAAGVSAVMTPPGRLLRLVGEFLADPEFPAFSRLLRHADVERCVRRAAMQRGGSIIREETNLLAALDAYGADHVHGRIDGTWLGGKREDPLRTSLLTAIYQGVAEMLSSLWMDGRPAPARPISAWMSPIVAVARLVSAGSVDEQEVAAMRVIETTARNMHEGARFGDLEPHVPPDAAIRLLLGELSRAQIPAPFDPEAVELVGWLEAVHDPAETIILTGMNEGCAPREAPADPLVPEALRQALGLSTRRATLARDLCLLTQAVHGHPRVEIIAGRRRVDGSRLWPSRLLLAADDATVARRIGWFLADPIDSPPPLGDIPKLRAQGPTRDAFSVMPIEPHEALREVSVTSFKRYMRSPYEFYLREVLELEDVPPLASELEARAFGDFLHRVLERFASSSSARSSDEGAIFGELRELAAVEAMVQFGHQPPTAVAVQLEQAMYRLKGFARWQAERARDGWEILHVEWKAPRLTLHPSEGELRVKGRIDRIDIHRARGEIALIDYKSGEGDKSAIKGMYRAASTSLFGPWTDLQLPLYRAMASPLAEQHRAKIVMGYVWLPKSGEVEWLEGTWEESVLDQGIEQAEELAGRMLRGEWMHTGNATPTDGPTAALLGVSIILPENEAEGGEE